MNRSKQREIVFGLAVGILLLVGSILVLRVAPVQAKASTLYVSATDPSCGGQSPCYTTIQAAVDAALDGDVIKVATGIYTGVQARDGITQVVYLTGSLTVHGGYITDDWSTPDPDANPVTVDAQGLGRGLVISGAITVTVDGLRITGGNATGLGGGSPLGADAGGGMYVTTSTVAISNCVIYSNTASTIARGWGGGLSLNHSVATLNGNGVINNTASNADWGRGGGLHIGDSTVTLSGNVVEGNRADTAGSGQGDGGGLFAWASTVTLIGNTVRDNTASVHGGGYGGGLHFWQSVATLSGNTVQGNTASTGYYGSVGKLYFGGGDTPLCDEIGIQGQGGGLDFVDSTATLSGNTIISNTASTVYGGFGGGLVLWLSTATLNGNSVQGNTGGTAAGHWAGGVGGGLAVVASTATLGGNTVRGNTASTASSGYGGGLEIWDSAVTLDGNTVQENTASGAGCGIGGGLNLWDSSATLNGDRIISNSAAPDPAAVGWGGGLQVQSSGSYILTNTVIAGNQANTGGSGLAFASGSAGATSGRLLHATIADNDGVSGQGVYVGEYAALALTNTIIAGHTSVGITVTAGSTATLEATLWHDNESRTGGAGHILTGTINIDGDPAFINPFAWDYHLTAGSAAIDKGVSAGVIYDMDGDPRPVDGDRDGIAVVDIGADELAWKHTIYLPVIRKSSGGPLQVGMVSDVAGMDDVGFNQNTWAGLQRANAELDVQVQFIESQSLAEYEANIAEFAEQGYDLVVTVGSVMGNAGSAMGNATANMAGEYPNTRMTIMDYSYDPPIPNVAGTVFAVDEAAFPAGYLAAGWAAFQDPADPQVGFVTGNQIPAVDRFIVGYINGVDYYNQQNERNVLVKGVWVNDFDSWDKGFIQGNSLIDEGVDVIFGVGGRTADGALAAAKERGKWGIGAEVDKYFSLPNQNDILLTSCLKRLDNAVFEVVRQTQLGCFPGGGVYLGTLENEGVGLAPYHDFAGQIPDELDQEVQAVIAGIIAGEIDTGWPVP